MVEHHEGAERPLLQLGPEKGIDHRQAVAQHVGQRRRLQAGVGLLACDGLVAVLEHDGPHRAGVDHAGIVANLHLVHPAAGMPVIEIALQKAELLARRLGMAGLALQHGVLRQHALPTPRHVERRHVDAHRTAGAARFARRAVGNRLRPAEAGTGQRVVEIDRAVHRKIGEHLPLHLARQVGAGLGRSQVELHLPDVVRRDDLAGVGFFHFESTLDGAGPRAP
jgi:hypothetical protein